MILAGLWIGFPIPNANASEPKSLLTAEAVNAAGISAQAERLLKSATEPNLHFPAIGLLVVEIVPDSSAEKEGIMPGSVLLLTGRFDRHPLRSSNTPKSGENDISWITPEGEMKSCTVPPGKAGITSIAYRNVVHWYLNHGNRHEKWDIHVVSALLAQSSDSALAESCWAAARAKGYRTDRLMHWSMAFILADREDFEGSKRHISAFGPLKVPETDSDFPLKNTDWVQLGMRTGEMSCIRQAFECFPDSNLNFSRDSLERMIEMASASPPKSQSPSALAEGMRHKSFLRDANDKGPHGKALPMLRKLHLKAAASDDVPPYRFEPELIELPLSKHRNTSLCPPVAARDMDVSIEFRMTPQLLGAGGDDPFIRGLVFGLMHSTNNPDILHVVMRANLFADNLGDDVTATMGIQHANCRNFSVSSIALAGKLRDAGPFQTLTMPVFRLDQGGYHTLRIVRVGDWAETLLDGKRMALMPVPPTSNNLHLTLQVVGSKVWVRSLRGDVLESP